MVLKPGHLLAGQADQTGAEGDGVAQLHAEHAFDRCRKWRDGGPEVREAVKGRSRIVRAKLDSWWPNDTQSVNLAIVAAPQDQDVRTVLAPKAVVGNAIR
jgi:hypothetical protein